MAVKKQASQSVKEPSKLVAKGKDLSQKVVKYWKSPPEGRYMNYKEILSFSVGGLGAKFIIWGIPQLMISVGNAFVCNTIGVGPIPVYVIWLLSVLSSFPLTALRAKMIDNARSMKGKYRPYILTMGLPTAIIGTLYVLFPYEIMPDFVVYAYILLINIALQFFFNFYQDAYTSLINVLSPNTIERSDVISFKAVIENLAPSICSIFMPLVAKLITGENTLYDLRVYRIVFPFIFFVGFVISMLIYVNTEEKIVQAKTHVIQVKFMDALKAVAKNKYFWVISLAGWLGFLEGTANSIIGWMYNYQGVCTPGQYSLIVTITGNASFWPMLIAPFFIRRFGKRRILIFTNLLSVGFFSLMLPIVRQTDSPYAIWLLMVCMFGNNFITTFGNLLVTGINADVRDYQQYITGERIDGMFSAVGLIGTVISLATSFILPTLYDYAGLNEAVLQMVRPGSENVYDVLYDPSYFASVSSVLVIASVVGAIMNLIPYLFYDLTESRQKAIVAVLKIRAMFEDFGNGVLRLENMGEVIAIIRDSEKYADLDTKSMTRDSIRAAKKEAIEGIRVAKKTGDKQKIREAKAAYRQMRELPEQIEIAQMVQKELHRFDTEEGRVALDYAARMAQAGLKGFLNVKIPTKEEAKAMPRATVEERERRREALTLINNMKSAQKAAKQYFPDGVEVFDLAVFDKLFAEEDEAERAIHDTLQAMKTARMEKNNTVLIQLKETLKNLRAEKSSIDKRIEKANDAHTRYYRAAQPYLDAVKLLTQSENYTHLDEILAQYAQYESQTAAAQKI